MPSFSQDGTTVVKIENAQKTEYKKNETTGEDEIVLTGAVELSVTKGNTVTKITASKIVFNRATNMVYADGSVTLKQTGGSSGAQDISAETLLFNTETLEGIFDNGKAVQASSDAINLPSGSQIFVASEMFGRDSSQTIAFNKATMTFCDEPDPHWKIWASKIWLLPGGEFAFLNAVLYVGHVPILYLPAFYYPKDELVFNPSFGYDRRKGYFFNSTTYLVGRKPLESSSSSSDTNDVTKGIINFLKPNTLKEQVREGLVLHNLESDYNGDTSTYLKIMADYYTNLGGMIGVQGSGSPNSFITNLNGYFDLGFSRTLFYDYATDSYIPYSNSGQMYNDHSNFMGLKLPFRYAGELNFTLAKPFSLRMTMPFYSDPYFRDDFDNRSEYMDWIGFLTSTTSNEPSYSNSITSFSWNLDASYSIPVLEAVRPYISSASLSASSSLVFGAKSAENLSSSDNWSSYTPQRLFYYPSQVTPLKMSGTISGTLFTYPKTERSTRESAPEFKIPLTVPDDFDDEKKSLADKNLDEETNDEEAIDDKKVDEKIDEKKFVLSESDLPLLNGNNNLGVEKIQGLRINVGYSVSPQFTTQVNYKASDIKNAEDFKWDRLMSSYFQMSAPATVSGSLNYGGEFFSMNTSMNFNPLFQSHPNLDGYDIVSASSIAKTDYNAMKMDLTNSSSFSFKPMVYNSVFKNSSISWSSSIKLLHAKFLGDETNPRWDFIGPDVTDPECVTSHSLAGKLSAIHDSNFSQSLTLTSSLPPQNQSYSATLDLVFPFVTTSVSGGISSSKDENGYTVWKKDSIRQSLTARFLEGTDNAMSFNESFNYDLENLVADSLRLAFNWRTLSLSFVMSNTYGYDFDESTGWNVRKDKEFLASNASLSYSLSGKNFNWFNSFVKFTPSLNTSLYFDFLRPTGSYFTFTPSLTFKINDILDLSFSAESRNTVIYRYVQDLFGNGIKIPGETNIFVDLLNSFAFWGDGKFIDSDQLKRKSSGFKLKRLSMTATHNLHDWDLSASFSISPRLVTENGLKQYNFDPYITLSVVWRPMSSMKAEVVDEYGTWKLN